MPSKRLFKERLRQIKVLGRYGDDYDITLADGGYLKGTEARSMATELLKLRDENLSVIRELLELREEMKRLSKQMESGGETIRRLCNRNAEMKAENDELKRLLHEIGGSGLGAKDPRLDVFRVPDDLARRLGSDSGVDQ